MSAQSPIGSAQRATQHVAHPLVELRGISKRFGTVQANSNISLSLQTGEVHTLLGENGAGKTTLLNILSGMIQPDSGDIFINGQRVTLDSPATALRFGIGTVYQHFALVPNLSIADNIRLGRQRSFVLKKKADTDEIARYLAEFGLERSPDTEIRHLALGERQRVELIKALSRGSRVLLLDEPTSILTPHEVDGLFAILTKLRKTGVAVVLITHKLEEALAISDRVTILRQGHVITELDQTTLKPEQQETTRAHIVELMFGGSISIQSPQSVPDDQTPKVSAPRLTLKNVTTTGDQGEQPLRDLSLEFFPGEIFGIAGVDGNGQKELAEVIAGQRLIDHGEIRLAGEVITNRGVRAAIQSGIGYITDDRLGEGCVAQASVADNLVLKTITHQPFSHRFWLNRRAIAQHAEQMIDNFDIRTPNAAAHAGLLSGGNIQKILLARELALNPTVLVCNKPTSGLDLKTAQFIIETLRTQADIGKTIILISPELDELLTVSDRIGVMDRGRLVTIVPRAQASAETIGQLILGGKQ